MTMASAFLPARNAAHEVSPMKGGIFHSSTFTATSLRGCVTLKTPSAAFHAPFSPVMCSMRLVSSGAAERRAHERIRARPRSRNDIFGFMEAEVSGWHRRFKLKYLLH